MGYLLARFPVGTFTFSVAVATYASALYLLSAPIAAPFDEIELGIWQADTVLEGLAVVPVGAILLLASAWLSEAMAAMSRALARWGAR
jgi:Putative sensor